MIELVSLAWCVIDVLFSKFKIATIDKEQGSCYEILPHVKKRKVLIYYLVWQRSVWNGTLMIL